MLGKIDGIHELELQLVKIEGNIDTRGNGNYSPMQGNNHIMNEIRGMLKEMIHSQNSVSKSVSVTNADSTGVTVNEMLEEVERAATRTATSLLSTIVKPQAQISVSPDLNSAASSLSSAALNKIDTFKAQLDEQNVSLKHKLFSLEEKLKHFETSNVNLNEIEQLKSIIVKTQRRFEEDKMKLIKEFENERNLTSNNNLVIMKKFKDDLETKINEKDDEMKKYMQHLNSMVPRNDQQRLVYDERVHQTTVESSFLTEEEETIARISERIHVLKAKIDAKDNNRRKNRSNNSDDSDDTDTRELVQLNDQIRQLKSRMLRKSDQLNHAKGIMKHDKVYLPIQHLKNRFRSEDNLHLIQAEAQFPVRSEIIVNKQPQYILTNHDSEDYSSSDDDQKKLFVVNRSNNRDLSCSPERRYTSSIEIPAEQLEDFKESATKKQAQPVRRAKSATHSAASAFESNHLKKHSAKFATGSNLISVCLRSLKKPENEKRASPDQMELTNNLKEAQREIEELKNIIEEKNTLINGQRVSSFDKKIHDKEMLYLLQVLENQSKKIIALKNKIKDLRDNGNWNSDTMSSLSDSLDRARNDLRDNLTTVNGSDIEDTFKKLKFNDENKRQRKNKVSYKEEPVQIKKRVKLVSELGVQTDDNTEANSLPQVFKNTNLDPTAIITTTTTDQYVDETQFQVPLNTLICNIPEHHDLEDLVHQNREEIISLKNLLQQAHDDLCKQQMNGRYDVDVMEKRAEFDALDLAINHRKGILFDLELRKRREMSSSMLVDDHYVPISEKGVKYLRVYIEICYFF
jgi:hypothetical protein